MIGIGKIVCEQQASVQEEIPQRLCICVQLLRQDDINPQLPREAANAPRGGENMSDPTVETSQLAANRAALYSLVIDNPEFELLEASLDQFNVFEALGAVRQELRHSRFLAFLLDPEENHGLGDEFARRVLQRVLIDAPE